MYHSNQHPQYPLPVAGYRPVQDPSTGRVQHQVMYQVTESDGRRAYLPGPIAPEGAFQPNRASQMQYIHGAYGQPVGFYSTPSAATTETQLHVAPNPPVTPADIVAPTLSRELGGLHRFYQPSRKKDTAKKQGCPCTML